MLTRTFVLFVATMIADYGCGQDAGDPVYLKEKLQLSVTVSNFNQANQSYTVRICRTSPIDKLSVEASEADMQRILLTQARARIDTLEISESDAQKLIAAAKIDAAMLIRDQRTLRQYIKDSHPKLFTVLRSERMRRINDSLKSPCGPDSMFGKVEKFISAEDRPVDQVDDQQ